MDVSVKASMMLTRVGLGLEQFKNNFRVRVRVGVGAGGPRCRYAHSPSADKLLTGWTGHREEVDRSLCGGLHACGSQPNRLIAGEDDSS